MSLRPPATAIGISGSVASTSRSRRLVSRALDHLAEQEVPTTLVDLAALPADALLARRTDPAVDDAIGQVMSAAILVVGTPIYRATYTGQLKAFFDLFPRDALVGHAVGLIATGYGEGHRLAIDHGLRPLIASLGGLTAARSIYVTDSQLPDPLSVPDDIDEGLSDLACELADLAHAIASSTAIRSALI
jgi:FMN reductase